MAFGLVWPLPIVMQPPFPVEAVQVPFSHKVMRIEPFWTAHCGMAGV